jgi:metal-responsive CopG/Arc/MetJ family transcriptional regulator
MRRVEETPMRKETVSIRLSGELLHELDQLAESNRVTRSRVVEKVLRNFLQQRAVTQYEVIRQRENSNGPR